MNLLSDDTKACRRQSNDVVRRKEDALEINRKNNTESPGTTRNGKLSGYKQKQEENENPNARKLGARREPHIAIN